MAQPPDDPAVVLELVPHAGGYLMIDVVFANLDDGERVDISFIENDATGNASIRAERVLGTLGGTVKEPPGGGRLFFTPDAPPAPSKVTEPQVTFRVKETTQASYGPSLAGPHLDVDRLHP